MEDGMFREKHAVKVVVEQTPFKGSGLPGLLQLAATVYISGKEFRVFAPPKASGDALNWVEHYSIQAIEDHPLDGVVEIDATDDDAALVLAVVKKELYSCA
jgi:hypothetical protein